MRSSGYSCATVRRRFEPLRVRPFGRLLASYTVNDFGDSIGVVALSVLVFDRTGDVAPTAVFFLVAKFLPALFATGLTAHLDRFSLRRVAARDLRDRGDRVRGARRSWPSGTGSSCRSCCCSGCVDGTLAITGRGLTRGAVAAALQPHGLISEGNALMNLGFAAASVFGAAIAGGLIAAFGLSAALFVDAASFLVIAVVLARRATCRGSSTTTTSRGTTASATASRSRAGTGSSARCCSASRSR